MIEQAVAQRERLREATLDLRHGLRDLATAAQRAAKQQAGLEEVYGAVNAVRRFEEAVDLAALDLATAEGEDA